MCQKIFIDGFPMVVQHNDMKHQLPGSSFQVPAKRRQGIFLAAGSWQLKARNRGFTLLLAALVSSIVLSLGASIFILAKKEVTLSSLGRDSQYAFYGADQAAECALYWDARWQYFATTTPDSFLPPDNDPTCDGQSWTPEGGARTGGASGTYPYTVTFQYEPTSAGVSYCATVHVLKCDGPIGPWNPQTSSATCTSATPSVIHTTVHADGYSTSCATLSTDPRALQRSVELHY
jgi:hypothetical protein